MKTLFERMSALARQPNPDQIYVPVKAEGLTIIDNGGDVIATCSSLVIASGVAQAINRDANV